MPKTIPLETQYSALIREARALLESVIDVRHSDGSLDPEFVIEKMDAMRKRQKVIMLSITRLRGDSVTALRKKYGPRCARVLAAKVGA